MKAITIRAFQELMILNERLTIIANLNSQLTISDLKVTSLDLCRNSLKPTEWPSHALLGTPALQQTLPCYEAVQGAIQEIEDYVGNPTLSRIGNFLKVVRTAIEEASHLINAIEEGLKTLRRTKIDFE